jgi:hypothetical protein
MKKKESVDVKKYTRQGTHGSTLLDLVRSKNPITPFLLGDQVQASSLSRKEEDT